MADLKDKYYITKYKDKYMIHTPEFIITRTLILPNNYKIEILRALKDLDEDIRKDIYDLINFNIIKKDFITNELLDLIHKDILEELYKDYIEYIYGLS